MFTRVFKRITLLILFLIPSSLPAANPLKRIETLIQPEGSVVFIKPQKLPCIKGKMSDMQYDITITTLNDSVYFSYSIMLDTPLRIDSCQFLLSGDSLTSKAERIYIEPKGKRWIYRLRSGITYDQFNKMSDLQTPFVFEIGGSSFQHDISKWNDYVRVYKLAQEIINTNK